jgi:hypothetical protein
MKARLEGGPRHGDRLDLRTGEETLRVPEVLTHADNVDPDRIVRVAYYRATDELRPGGGASLFGLSDWDPVYVFAGWEA